LHQLNQLGFNINWTMVGSRSSQILHQIKLDPDQKRIKWIGFGRIRILPDTWSPPWSLARSTSESDASQNEEVCW